MEITIRRGGYDMIGWLSDSSDHWDYCAVFQCWHASSFSSQHWRAAIWSENVNKNKLTRFVCRIKSTFNIIWYSDRLITRSGYATIQTKCFICCSWEGNPTSPPWPPFRRWHTRVRTLVPSLAPAASARTPWSRYSQLFWPRSYSDRRPGSHF